MAAERPFLGEDLNASVARSIKFASAHTCASRVYPDVIEERSVVRKAKKLGDTSDIVIQRTNFEEEVKDRYSSLKPGDVRLLVAATGTGKSTRLPCAIAAAFSVRGVVVIPNALLAASVHEYVRTKVAGELYPNVKALMLRTSECVSPTSGNIVYYTTAAEFLAMYARDLDLIDKLKLDFVYVDEAHEKSPEQYMFRTLVASAYFQNTKVFFGSATANSVNLEDAGSYQKKICEVPVDQMNPLLVSKAGHTSPLHHTNIGTRVLVFVSNREQSDVLMEYYESHDIPVYRFDEYSRTSEYVKVNAEIANNTACVLITTSLLQTGHTLNVDKVIDCGETRKLKIADDGAAIELVTAVESMSERLQRLGRVGRCRPGMGYFPAVTSDNKQTEVVPGSECYVFLWCRVFGIESNTTLYKMGHMLLGDMTVKKASLLLHSRVHPVVMTHYMDPYGDFYCNWVDVFDSVFPQANLSSTEDDSIFDTVRGWRLYTSHRGDFSEGVDQFRMPVSVPDEWTAVLYVAFRVVADEEFQPDYIDEYDSRTVVSMAKTSVGKVAKHKTFVPPPRQRDTIDISSMGYKARKPRDKSHGLEHTRKRGELPKIPTMATIREKVSHETFISPPIAQSRDTSLVRKPVEEISRPVSRDRVEEIRGMPELKASDSISVVGSSRRRRHTSRRESDSSSGSSLYSLKYGPEFVRILASSLGLKKVYPMDERLRALYLDTEPVTPKDMARYRELKENDVFITRLTGTRKDSYFLSVVRVRNEAVVNFTQRQALYKPSLFRAYTPKVNTHEVINDKRLDRGKVLLTAFEQEKYFVGVDKRTRHTGEGVQNSPTFQNSREMAVLALTVGNDALRDAVEALMGAVAIVRTNEKPVAVGLRVLEGTVMPYHSLSDSFGEIAGLHGYLAANVDFVKDICYAVGGFESAGSVLPADFLVRSPIMHEDALAVGINFDNEEPIVLGEYTIFGTRGMWATDAKLVPGCSGMVYVSVDDGAFLGMHVGETGTGQANEMSTFVSAVDIFDFLHKFD